MKKITAENWLEIDPIIASGVFVRMALADGTVWQITPQDWTERLLVAQLSAAVPNTVRDQVEIARAVMIYGSLFYPLFTLGLEQLFRVTEAAAPAKASQLGKRKGRKYHEILADLRASGVLTDDEYESWSGMRRFRNATTHANEAMILPPGAAIGMFATIVASIDRLFAASV